MRCPESIRSEALAFNTSLLRLVRIRRRHRFGGRPTSRSEDLRPDDRLSDDMSRAARCTRTHDSGDSERPGTDDPEPAPPTNSANPHHRDDHAEADKTSIPNRLCP